MNVIGRFGTLLLLLSALQLSGAYRKKPCTNKPSCSQMPCAAPVVNMACEPEVNTPVSFFEDCNLDELEQIEQFVLQNNPSDMGNQNATLAQVDVADYANLLETMQEEAMVMAEYEPENPSLESAEINSINV